MTEITVEKILPQYWHKLGELAHTICFGEHRPESLNRHHFIIGVFGNKELAGYFTCLEMDSETVYIQHGGVFPNYEKTVNVVPGYLKMLELLSGDFRRAWTRIENKNSSMIKMALKAGFIIQGVYVFKRKTFVELEVELNKETLIQEG